MNFSRQALLGIGMIVGGSVMLYAMVQQVGGDNNPEQTTAIVDTASPDTVAAAPLTTDIDTEKRLLAQKQKERAARVAEQERRAEQFLAEQETAESQALAKARAENERYRDNIAESENDEPEQEPVQETTLVTPTVQPQTIVATSEVASTDNQVAIAAQQQQERQAQEAAKRAEAQEAARLAQAQQQAQTDAKAKQKEQEQAAARQKQIEDRAAAEKAKSEPPTSPTDYKVKRGDGLIKLARQYNVPVAALAQANDIAPSTDLRLGQTLTIPSRKQIERLEREAAAAERSREEKRKKEEALAKKSTEAKRDAQQKLSAARQTVKETDAKGSFGVQVALAGNQAKADEVAKKFKSAGYQVKTSATSRGVRVVVGPERGKIAALALKDKVNSDPKVDTTSAWVLYW